MRSRITKLATSAAAAAALIIGVYLFTNPPGGGNVAWAIEQSVQAHNEVTSVHITGTCTDRLLLGDKGSDDVHTFDLWARRGRSELMSGQLRFARSDSLVIVVQGNTSFLFYPPENTVYITDGQKMMLSPWCGGGLFQTLKEKAKNWDVVHGEDKETGRKSAFVTCSFEKTSRSWWFQFDVETKLLVRFKQWNGSKREGVPAFETKEIVYNKTLGDDLFKYEIPDGVRVVDKRKKQAATEPATDSEDQRSTD